MTTWSERAGVGWVGLVGALAIVVLLAISYADRYLPAISDWYLNIAAPYAGTTRLSAATAASVRGDDEAYLACVRDVAKKRSRNGIETVVTFAPEDESTSVRIGDDRYVIRSTFDEAFENGATAESVFCCVVRREEEAWRVQSVKILRVSTEGEPPAGA